MSNTTSSRDTWISARIDCGMLSPPLISRSSRKDVAPTASIFSQKWLRSTFRSSVTDEDLILRLVRAFLACDIFVDFLFAIVVESQATQAWNHHELIGGSLVDRQERGRPKRFFDHALQFRIYPKAIGKLRDDAKDRCPCTTRADQRERSCRLSIAFRFSWGNMDSRMNN